MARVPGVKPLPQIFCLTRKKVRKALQKFADSFCNVFVSTFHYVATSNDFPVDLRNLISVYGQEIVVAEYLRNRQILLKIWWSPFPRNICPKSPEKSAKNPNFRFNTKPNFDRETQILTRSDQRLLLPVVLGIGSLCFTSFWAKPLQKRKFQGTWEDSKREKFQVLTKF